MEILIFGALLAYMVGRKLDKFNSLWAAVIIIVPVKIVNLFPVLGSYLIHGGGEWWSVFNWRTLVPIAVQVLVMWLIVFLAKKMKKNSEAILVMVLGSLVVLFIMPLAISWLMMKLHI